MSPLAPLRRLNTRLKLFEKVSLLLIVMVLLATVNIVVIYSYHQQTERLGNSVNIAGQQRMLSQRMVRLANEVAQDDGRTVRPRLRRSIERYDSNLDALSNGGTVTDMELNPGAQSDSDLASVTLRGEQLDPAPEAVRDELAEERRRWNEYEPHIRTILEADPDSQRFQRSLQYVRSNSDGLLSVSDAVTAEFASIIRRERAELEQVLVALLVIDVLVAVVGTLFARQFIGLPMSTIARRGRRLAAGDTDFQPETAVPVDRSLPEYQQRSEISELAQSFDAVQGYHKTVAEQANALAERDFSSEVLDESVPGELGDSLDTMREDLDAYIHDLRMTTEKLDAVIQASPAAILIMDPDGTIRRWNPAAESIFGWSQSEAEGQANPAVPEERWDEHRRLLSAVMTGDPVTGVERQWTTADGEPIDVSVSVASIADDDGTLSGVMAVVEDITDRKARERTLRQQRDQLEILNQVTELVLRITQELVESTSRDRIENRTVETLGSSDVYDVAWIAERPPGSDELRVRTCSARDHSGESIDRVQTDPVTATIHTCFETGDIQVGTLPAASKSPLTEPDASNDRDDRETESKRFAVVPLSYLDTVYGVLVVSTHRDEAFQERELAGLTSLGKTVGFAINAITNERLLFADTVNDLSFDISDTDFPLVTTSTALDCAVSLDGFVKGSAGSVFHLYLEIEGVDAASFVDAVVEEPAVADANLITDEEAHRRVSVAIKDGSILHRLAHLDVTPKAIELESGHGRLTVEAPIDANVEPIVDVLRSADDRIDFVAKTKQDRPVTTAAETATTLKEQLTDRQYEVFKTAYYGGYFEWPRDNTIEELAENMGIAGSTFNHHLRHAQRKLAEALYSTPDPENRPTERP
ncbi:MAG TPA: bacterio-opsin activator domain-containing protein [Natrialbaceae archaeon]|nr:bacterio-opsin activator domain-containing protein [Natrialbaceae archaeon]